MLLPWLAVGLLVSLGALQLAVERLVLWRTVANANRTDALKRAVRRLPGPARPIMSGLVDSVERGASIDDALSRALVQAAQVRFSGPLVLHILITIATVGLVLTPVVASLASTAADIAVLSAEARSQPPRLRYLNGADSLHPSFAALGKAFDETAFVVAALALAWALRWWLLRPEVREARLVQALVRVAGRLRPNASAPASARLAELIAPERGIGRPVVATGLWVGAVTLGWLAMLGAARVDAESARRATFDVWPSGTERRIETFAGVLLPRSDAGAPIARTARPTLSLAPATVQLHDVALAALVDGALAPDWLSRAPSAERELRDFPRPLEVTVLGHRELPLGTILEVFRALTAKYDIVRFHLIVERGVAIDGSGRLQASLPMEIIAEPVAPITLLAQADGVRLFPSRAFVPFSFASWAADLRDQVRGLPAIWSEGTRPAIAVEAEPTLTYGRLVEVLSAADGSCPGAVDCGLPGLDLRFLVDRQGPGR